MSIFSEEKIEKLEQELVNANDLLTAMKSQSKWKCYSYSSTV